MTYMPEKLLPLIRYQIGEDFFRIVLTPENAPDYIGQFGGDSITLKDARFIVDGWMDPDIVKNAMNISQRADPANTNITQTSAAGVRRELTSDQLIATASNRRLPSEPLKFFVDIVRPPHKIQRVAYHQL